VRIGRETWSSVSPADVAWVVEWQLAAALPWVPLDEEATVHAAERPEPSGTWEVTVRVGNRDVRAGIPVRDVGKVVGWCRRARNRRALFRPPPAIRGSLLGLRRALQAALVREDPLHRMGYAAQE
jgi:hypothetical protein